MMINMGSEGPYLDDVWEIPEIIRKGIAIHPGVKISNSRMIKNPHPIIIFKKLRNHKTQLKSLPYFGPY